MTTATTASMTGVYLEYLRKKLPPWMKVYISFGITTNQYIVEIKVDAHILVDDEYGKLITPHSIATMVAVDGLESLKHIDLHDKFMTQVDKYLAKGTFDEYDYDEEGERIEESKRVRTFTNWVILHDGFPHYMKGVKK